MEPTTVLTPPTAPTLPPTYKQMLEAMGQQLSSRKSALMKRVLLITWPFLLLIVVGYIAGKVYDFHALPQSAVIPLGFGFGAYVLLALIYSTIVRFVFQIEKQIWVDSFFDGKNLPLEESWRIAKKLLWPAFMMRVKLWGRYIGLPLVILVVVALLYLNMLVVNRGVNDTFLTGSLIGFLVVFILFTVYTYYIRLKLRFSWFIFLDKFGIDNSFNGLITEINKLNMISRSESFKRSLAANIGTDSMNAVIKLAVGAVSFGVSGLGMAGKMVGSLVRVYGEEMSKQATELGNIAGQYILYRFARKEAYGNEQEVNENIYSL